MSKFKRAKPNKTASSKEMINAFMQIAKDQGYKNYTRKDAKKEYNDLLNDELYLNDTYQVSVSRTAVPNADFWEKLEVKIVHLSIKRIDRDVIHDWRELQRIKNELMGEEYMGVEVYPFEENLRDGANQFHIWVFTDLNGDPLFIPIGWQGRVVANDGEHSSAYNVFGRVPKQRAFEEVDDD